MFSSTKEAGCGERAPGPRLRRLATYHGPTLNGPSRNWTLCASAGSCQPWLFGLSFGTRPLPELSHQHSLVPCSCPSIHISGKMEAACFLTLFWVAGGPLKLKKFVIYHPHNRLTSIQSLLCRISLSVKAICTNLSGTSNIFLNIVTERNIEIIQHKLITLLQSPLHPLCYRVKLPLGTVAMSLNSACYENVCSSDY